VLRKTFVFMFEINEKDEILPQREIVYVTTCVVAVGCLIYSAMVHDELWMMVGAGLVALLIFGVFLFFVKSLSQRCSLCSSPLWAARKCQKSSKVKSAFGISYRLGMAMSIITKGHYRCPYCGEPFNARKSRDRRK